MIINKDDINIVYRNNCEGDIPPKISKKNFNKISKLVNKRKEMSEISIPKYNSINKKKYTKLIFDRLGMTYVKSFPSSNYDKFIIIGRIKKLYIFHPFFLSPLFLILRHQFLYFLLHNLLDTHFLLTIF